LQPQYLEEQSAPGEQRYLFAYTVTIRNTGEVAAQLLSRHWIITDADGQIEEVRGPGVVASSRCSSPASRSGTPAAARWPHRSARCTAAISASPRMARVRSADPRVRALGAAHAALTATAWGGLLRP